MLFILDFIKDKFGDLTAEEIKQAFKMYVAKEFPDIKVFRILDSIVVGDVLNAFREYRNESLRTYSQKKQLLLTQEVPISESEKKEIRKNLLKLIQKEIKENNQQGKETLYDEVTQQLLEGIYIMEYNSGTYQRVNPILERSKSYIQYVGN